ncbi:hypothetical protein B0T25DRAFT_259830 [Lasiosphaeria hispida]|uniref:Uncharacterized protein n=1 Tax=Lasiosphaeria hispida TaxID=260671 RepID=A0AAJ0HGE3_9PEZI|nr:hypothetical protein B0T25DRAFT_259830 [Lasiosphaeria hispida]
MEQHDPRQEPHPIFPGESEPYDQPASMGFLPQSAGHHRRVERPIDECYVDQRYEMRYPVTLFSPDGNVHAFQAVFSTRLPYSLVYPSTLRFLNMQPVELRPNHPTRKAILSHLGRIQARQYTGLCIELSRLGVLDFEHVLVLDEDRIPYRGVDIFFGRAFVKKHLDGVLPGYTVIENEYLPEDAQPQQESRSARRDNANSPASIQYALRAGRQY